MYMELTGSDVDLPQIWDGGLHRWTELQVWGSPVRLASHPIHLTKQKNVQS